MKMRTKSAMVVLIGLALAFYVIFSFSYTDRYISDRFHKGVDSISIESGRAFSLDALMQFYDWDSVCMVLPGSDRDFTNLFGREYEPRTTDMATWSLVFLKEGAVTAEITIDRTFLEHPPTKDEPCVERWAAVFYMDLDDHGRRRLRFSGN